MNTERTGSLGGADTSKTKRGTIIGKEGRSIAVRYGKAVVDVLLIRPCDFHGVPSLDEGTEVELRYTDHGAAGAWWHAHPVSVISRIVDQNDALWELLTSSDSKSPEEKLALLRRAFPGAKSLENVDLSDPEYPESSADARDAQIMVDQMRATDETGYRFGERFSSVFSRSTEPNR